MISSFMFQSLILCISVYYACAKPDNITINRVSENDSLTTTNITSKLSPKDHDSEQTSFENDKVQSPIIPQPSKDSTQVGATSKPPTTSAEFFITGNISTSSFLIRKLQISVKDNNDIQKPVEAKQIGSFEFFPFYLFGNDRSPTSKSDYEKLNGKQLIEMISFLLFRMLRYSVPLEEEEGGDEIQALACKALEKFPFPVHLFKTDKGWQVKELTSPLNETLDSLQYWIDMTNEIVLIAANTDNFAKELRYRSYFNKESHDLFTKHVFLSQLIFISRFMTTFAQNFFLESILTTDGIQLLTLHSNRALFPMHLDKFTREQNLTWLYPHTDYDSKAVLEVDIFQSWLTENDWKFDDQDELTFDLTTLNKISSIIDSNEKKAQTNMAKRLEAYDPDFNKNLLVWQFFTPSIETLALVVITKTLQWIHKTDSIAAFTEQETFKLRYDEALELLQAAQKDINRDNYQVSKCSARMVVTAIEILARHGLCKNPIQLQNNFKVWNREEDYMDRKILSFDFKPTWALPMAILQKLPFKLPSTLYGAKEGFMLERHNLQKWYNNMAEIFHVEPIKNVCLPEVRILRTFEAIFKYFSLKLESKAIKKLEDDDLDSIRLDQQIEFSFEQAKPEYYGTNRLSLTSLIEKLIDCDPFWNKVSLKNANWTLTVPHNPWGSDEMIRMFFTYKDNSPTNVDPDDVNTSTNSDTKPIVLKMDQKRMSQMYGDAFARKPITISLFQLCPVLIYALINDIRKKKPDDLKDLNIKFADNVVYYLDPKKVRDLVVNQSFPHWFKMQYFSMKTQYLYLKMQDFNAQSVGGKKLTEQKEDSKNNKIWDYQFAEPVSSAIVSNRMELQQKVNVRDEKTKEIVQTIETCRWNDCFLLSLIAHLQVDAS